MYDYLGWRHTPALSVKCRDIILQSCKRCTLHRKKKYCHIFFASCSLKSHAEHTQQPHLTRHCKEDWEHTAATLSTRGNSVYSN